MSALVRVVCATVRGDCSSPLLTWQRTLEMTARLGVVVLGSLKHDFPGGGITGLVALAESHVAIHTWPERGALWVEFATCGDPKSLDVFLSELATWGSVELEHRT